MNNYYFTQGQYHDGQQGRGHLTSEHGIRFYRADEVDTLVAELEALNRERNRQNAEAFEEIDRLKQQLSALHGDR